MAFPRLVLSITLCLLALPLGAQQACTASSPLASFKLYVKPPRHAAFPLREVNELLPGMKIQYQPLHITGTNPGDARIALILAESTHAMETQRLLVMEAQRADHVAEWELPFRTEIVALVFGPQGLSASKVGNLLKKDAVLVKELAAYAEQNQRAEELIQLLAVNEGQPRTGESLDAALAGFAARHGMPTTVLKREAPTSEQAMVLMRALNPAISTFDPLAPNPAQRMQQTAGLAAAVAGLFWGSNVALYAGGAGLFLNMRSLLFPGAEFRSALLQATNEQQLTLCARNTLQRSRTRVAYLWATRIPDAPAPAITFSDFVDAGAGLDTFVPVALGEDAVSWRLVARAQQWRLLAADGSRQFPISVTPDATARALRFRVPTGVHPGLYQMAARWDWRTMRPNGYLRVHALASGPGPSVSEHSRSRLLEGARDVEIAIEHGDFRFVEAATLMRKGDPYAIPRPVPHRLVKHGDDNAVNLFVLLNGAPLERGMWQLILRQTGGKELEVDLPVLPQPPSISNLPLKLNVGASAAVIRLEGQRLELVDGIEAEGITFTRMTPVPDPGKAGSLAALEFQAGTSAMLTTGARVDVRVRLNDRPDPLLLPAAIEILGPLPQLLSSRLAHRESNGVELRQNELAVGGLVTMLLTVRHGSSSARLLLGCKDGFMQTEALALQPGQSSRDARLHLSSPDSLYLTLDPGRVGQHGCLLESRLQTTAGLSAPLALGRVVRLPQLESLSLTDELMGENLFAATLTGRDLEAIAAVGWEAEHPVPVNAIPQPREGDSRHQELRISLPWPSPTPRAPILIWLHEETQGRLTNTRAGS